jgi:polyferredoxin
MVTLTINEQRVEASEGSLLLDVIKDAGIDVPTLCFHKDLTPWGGCRLCSVELSSKGRSSVTASCNLAVEEGMSVQTHSPRVLAVRKMMAELYLAQTPNVPAIQRIAASLGVESARFGDATSDEDCILCGMCVRACQEVAKKDVLGFVDRGPERVVTQAFGEYNATACDTCNSCITYCPTGAITHLPNLPIGRRWYEAAKKWVGIRKGVQYGLLALFAFFFLTTSQKWWGTFNVVNMFSRLDPLQAIAASIADRSLILLYVPAILTILATFAFGRVWCGWVCPLGAILDLFGPKGSRKMRPWWRQVKYGILFVILLMAGFGSLAFMFFDPITILVRGVADPIAVVQSVIEQHAFGIVWRSVTLISVVPLVAILLLNRMEKRFWCRYLCPLGAIVALGSKVSWIRRRVDKEKCVTCGDCVKVCPMGAINPGTIDNDPAECVMCMDCPVPCPKTAISFPQQPTPRWNHEFDPGRRELVGSVAASAAGLVLFNTSLARAESPDLLRPPGVAPREDRFLTQCIRCGQCVQACPGHVLHPAWLGMSWGSFWTPALVPTQGGCQTDCNRCGQVCPSGAIPNLSLEEKKQQVMGIAVVDEILCINCMVCEKACPTQAIGRVEIRKPDAKRTRKPLPVVTQEKCNGCGQCEFVCPAPPSIKVWTLAGAPKGGKMLQRV